MAKKTDLLANIKGADELHIKDVGVFFLKDKKAYYADGRPVEKDKLFVCQFCQTSPPLVTPKEIDFVKHVLDKHPEHATKKIEKAVEKVVEKVDAGKEIDPKKVAATEKAKAELLSLDQMTKEELLVVAKKEGIGVSEKLITAELLAEIRAKMPVSNNPRYI